MIGGAPGAGPTPGAGPGASNPQQVVEGILGLAQQIEKSLMSFAQAMPNGARFFNQANELIKQGIASELQATGGENAPAVSPTNAGPQFPGGGMSSAPKP